MAADRVVWLLLLLQIGFRCSPSTGAPLIDEQCEPAKGVLLAPEDCGQFHNQLNNKTARICCPVFQNDPSCGKVSRFDATAVIYDSRETHLDQFPWATIIMPRWQWQISCSGSLINRNFVLSAAHCFQAPMRLNNKRHQYKAVFGDWDVLTDEDCKYVRGELECNGPIQHRQIAGILNHPLYDHWADQFLHDIALLKLERPIEYESHIGPVCLPSYSSVMPEIAGRNYTATGWGKTRTWGGLRRKLKVTMVARNVSVCARAYGINSPEVAQVQLCVGGEPRKDVCHGDSGGALMQRENADRWTQVGIISFGSKKCGKALPGVYTNLARYTDWIQASIETLEKADDQQMETTSTAKGISTTEMTSTTEVTSTTETSSDSEEASQSDEMD
ncbi:CLIP domain-containing serine protease 14D-like [Anopheles aquasalis]|uniref:CLIP domain-containing serine protease 14D-like n=1 Tax=Anopheles aquasalis TaxID=42839 RepID=UPI00215AD93D|nr:CLIP domain-containing serine protease 14D-like [Anopheles aquasalis]